MTELKLQTLIDRGACQSQVDLFRARFGESVDITPELCESVASEFGFEWAAENLLTPTARKECRRVMEAAYAEYERVVAPAYAEYERVVAPAYAEYERVVATAVAECERVKNAADAEYERVVATAVAECERVTEAAYAEYERVVAREFARQYIAQGGAQ